MMVLCSVGDDGATSFVEETARAFDIDDARIEAMRKSMGEVWVKRTKSNRG
jgi:hypothetical protein